MPGSEQRSEAVGPGTGRPCANCGKPTTKKFHPFCSKRCADIDLGRWLTGAYAIPAVEEEPDMAGEAADSLKR